MKPTMDKRNRVIEIPDGDTGYEMIKKEFNKNRKYCLDYRGYLSTKCKIEKVD
jgi:hypothetical protein